MTDAPNGDFGGGTPRPGERIGLALSGGGLRATLFHLGVVEALRKRELLSSVQAICSVSGGSVLGAHMVLNWREYTGSDSAFATVKKQILDFASRDVRGHILRRVVPATILRWLCEGGAGVASLIRAKGVTRQLGRAARRLRATGMLERQYRFLYGDSTLDALKGEGRPELYILATNLNTLSRCTYSHAGFEWGTGCEAPVAPRVLTLSSAVSASSAFPGFFPPVVLTREELALDEQGLRFRELYLTDAGVHDNLGTSPFRELCEDPPAGPLANSFSGEPLDRLLVSDGTGRTDWTRNRRVSRLSGTAIRAIDAFMTRSRDLQEALAKRDRLAPIFMRISREIPPELRGNRGLSQAQQRQLQYIRTDLDTFHPYVREALVEHGRCVGLVSLAGTAETGDPGNEHAPVSARVARKQLDILRAARYRQLGLFAGGDSLASAGNLLLLLLFGVVVSAGFNQLPNLLRKVPALPNVVGIVEQAPLVSAIVSGFEVDAQVSGMQRVPDDETPEPGDTLFGQTLAFDTPSWLSRIEFVEGSERYVSFWEIKSHLWPVSGRLQETIRRRRVSEPGQQIDAANLVAALPQIDDSINAYSVIYERSFELGVESRRVRLHYEPPSRTDTVGALFILGGDRHRSAVELGQLHRVTTSQAMAWTPLNVVTPLYAQHEGARSTEVHVATVRDWLTDPDLQIQLLGRRYLLSLEDRAHNVVRQLLDEELAPEPRLRLLHNVDEIYRAMHPGVEQVPVDLRVAIGAGFYDLRDFSSTIRYLEELDAASVAEGVFFLRGYSYMVLGRYSESITNLEAFHSRTDVPEFMAVTSSNLGIALRRWESDSVEGRAERMLQAEEMFRRAMDEDPTNPDPKNNLAYLIAEADSSEERLTEALDLVDAALGVRPGEPSFLDTKGWVLYRGSVLYGWARLIEAETLIRRAIELAPDRPLLKEHLDAVQRELGRQ